MIYFLVVLGQVAWLGWQNYSAERELVKAPRILLPAEVTPYCVRALQPELPLSVDSSVLGKSIWWDLDWTTDRALNNQVMLEARRLHLEPDQILPLPRRPEPGAEVSGAQKIRSDRLASPYPLSAFLQQKEDGLWHVCRIESAGSSEDVPREGEVRLYALLIWGDDPLTLCEQGDKYVPSVILQCKFIKSLYAANCGIAQGVSDQDSLQISLKNTVFSPRPVDKRSECAPEKMNATLTVALCTNTVVPLSACVNGESPPSALDNLKAEMEAREKKRDVSHAPRENQ